MGMVWSVVTKTSTAVLFVARFVVVVREQVRVSYLEIYEERIYDLLDVSNRDKTVEEWATACLLTNSEGNQVVKGLTTFEVESEGNHVAPSRVTIARRMTTNSCGGKPRSE